MFFPALGLVDVDLKQVNGGAVSLVAIVYRTGED